MARGQAAEGETIGSGREEVAWDTARDVYTSNATHIYTHRHIYMAC